MDDAEYNAIKDKIVAYLGTLEGKGVDKTVSIAKNVGVSRKICSQVLNQMEIDGIVQPAGLTAGVAGYKLKG